MPLPLDPTKLRGLSERLIRQHHENNYGGAVKNLNRAEEELARTYIEKVLKPWIKTRALHNCGD